MFERGRLPDFSFWKVDSLGVVKIRFSLTEICVSMAVVLDLVKFKCDGLLYSHAHKEFSLLVFKIMKT